ncbi:protein nirF [Kiloniella laminariae]|uniref:Protein nirF n=2 Tax=Kiloniella laminariae TaxID=454162 RepID=A0ABT4LGU9_9PROT|nr:protein nirF [Kiloniella laminariae]
MTLGLAACSASGAGQSLRGTGDLGVVIARATGELAVIDTTNRAFLSKVSGLGDLSHASVVYSRDERYAYVFGRDGGLTKVDILAAKIVKRVIQSGNSIGGAISQDGTLVAVANYEPGGVKVFDARTLELIVDIPAVPEGGGARSKVIGLVDAPGNRFVFSLWDHDEIWVADMADPRKPEIQKFQNVGRNPYDALITPDGRYYIAGLFGEDGMALLDLWHPEQGVQRILGSYGKGEDDKRPVYKMPHLEGWAIADDLAFVPAVGRHEVLVIDMTSWREIQRIPVAGQPVFVMARPDGRQVWVNFAFPDYHQLQVISSESREVIKTLPAGKGVLHMEFHPRGEIVWVSVRDENKIIAYNTETFDKLEELALESPSGIFLSARAHKPGL